MHISPHDPFRPVDWRWRRATWLRSEGKYSRRDRDDQSTILAKKYQAARDKAASPIEQANLAEKFPGIHYAHAIHRQSDQDERWTIEARILANQTPQEIADRQGITPEVVYWFEKLFFDVRDKLHCRDYIANRVLGPAAHRGIFERDYDLLLKIYALVGGAAVVDVLVDMTGLSGRQPVGAQEIRVFFTEDHADSLRRKAAIAARCVPLNSYTQQFVLELFNKLMALEKEQDRGADTGTLIVTNIHAALQTLPLQVGPPDPDRDHYQRHGAIELRGDQQMARVLGLPGNVEPELAGFKFPEAGQEAEKSKEPAQ